MNLFNTFKPKNILVTGGCGFIFSNFINYMLSTYNDITIYNIDRLDYCASTLNIDKEFRESNRYIFYNTDLNSKELILDILKSHSIDTVIHGSAQSSVDNSFGNSLQFTQDNIVATHTLLECCEQYKFIKRFIYISTDEVVVSHDINDKECFEDAKINAQNPYSATKAAAEFIALSYYYSFKLPIIITRFNNVIGPRQYPDKLIPKTITYLLENKKIPIHGTGLSRRNFIYVDDVCSGVDTVIKKGEISNIYHIGSNDEYNVIEIIKMIIKKMESYIGVKHFQNVVEFVEDRPINDFRYTINCDKIKKLGWEKQVSFDDALNKTIEWYTNKIINFIGDKNLEN